VVFINAKDLQDIGMKAGDWVDITSLWADGEHRRAEKFVLIEYDIPRGCLASYFPETNALVPLSSVAIGAGTPTSKSIPVVLTLRPQDAPLAAARSVREAHV
jgi:anaerobic selenocysteine-containing dehydrogenase